MKHILERGVETVWRDIPESEREGADYVKWKKMSLQVVEPVLKDRTNKIYVSEDENGDFAGYIVVGETKNMFSPAGYGFIYDIFVEERFRRRGIASMLLKTAEDFCTAKGLRIIKLEVAASNSVALGLYEGKGFAPERVFLGKKIE
ncbi:MAG: GNAT family N-acetyltransferase, partial [Thermoplasmata archaeon]